MYSKSYRLELIEMAIFCIAIFLLGMGQSMSTQSSEVDQEDTNMESAGKVVQIKQRDIILKNMQRRRQQEEQEKERERQRVDEISAIVSSSLSKLNNLENSLNSFNARMDNIEQDLDVLKVVNPVCPADMATAANARDLNGFACSCNGEVMLKVNGLTKKFYCEYNDRPGLVIQRRYDGSENFYRNWREYADGFGDFQGEFWLGLQKIHEVTSSARYVLRVDLEDHAGLQRWAEFDYFQVYSESNNFRMAGYGSLSGTAGDCLSHHLGYGFSTKDRDNDGSSQHCAIDKVSGWWYNNCGTSDLNRLWNSRPVSSKGIQWTHWKSNALRKSQMKLIRYS